MANHRKFTSKTHSLPGAVILGTIISLLVSLLLGLLITVLIRGGSLEETAIGWSAKLALAVSAFIGTMTAAAGKDEKVMIICAIAAVAIYLCHIGSGAVVFGSGMHGLGAGALMVIVGSGSVMLLNTLSKKSVRSKKNKYRFR